MKIPMTKYNQFLRSLLHHKFRFIEDLRDRYKDTEIWILATGPSLDDFPDDFFDNRISIALKFAAIAFPLRTFILFLSGDLDYGPVDWIKEGHGDRLTNSIVAINSSKFNIPDWPGNYSLEPYYMAVRFSDSTKKQISQAVGAIINGEQYNYPRVITTLHYAIQAAAIMGAQKITLIGCDALTSLWNQHAQKRGVGEAYRKDYGGEPMDGEIEGIKSLPAENMRKGTRWFVEEFARHRVEVCRYFYGKGYENGFCTGRFKHSEKRIVIDSRKVDSLKLDRGSLIRKIKTS